MAHAAFLRSPYPHARIVSIDVAAARALPGVRAVLTGAEIQTMTGAFLGMMPLDGLYDPPYFALAVDRVRLVGDPVAIVVADTRRVAEDGCELIDVEYEELPAVATMAQARDPLVRQSGPRPAATYCTGARIPMETLIRPSPTRTASSARPSSNTASPTNPWRLAAPSPRSTP